MKSIRMWGGAAAIAIVAMAPAAFFQPAYAQIPKMLVTARRVAEDVQTIPLQVTALSADKLQSANVANLEQLQYLVPSLIVTGAPVGGYGSFSDFSLRGASRTQNTDVVVQPYLNEVPVNTIGLNYQIFDIESVQILEGPQGVAFGKNSTGGAILYQTRA